MFSFYTTNYFKAMSQGRNTSPQDMAKGSTLIIGGYDTKKYADPNAGEIDWIPLKSRYFWTL